MLKFAEVLSEIKSVSAASADPKREKALATLRRAFLEATISGGQDESNEAANEAATVPLQHAKLADHGAAWRGLRTTTTHAPCAELRLADALTQRDYSTALCLLSEITCLPFSIVDHVFLAPAHEALLILARAENFAWSTMRLLITAHQDNWTKTQNTKPRSLDMERLAIEFDGFPRPVAERALRFIRAFALAKPVANFTHH